MAETEKPKLPPYVGFSAFVGFLNKFRETRLPGKIDRSLLGNASGSMVSSMLAALRSLDLTDVMGRPTPAMKKLVEATDEERKVLFAELLKTSYGFLFDDEHFDLSAASTGQMAEKFRSANVSGSTISKCISFFLALAKAADFTVSPHVKVPPPPRSNGKKAGKVGSKKGVEAGEGEDESEEEPIDPSVHRFEIPIPGKSSVKVIVPNDLDADDWEMLKTVFSVYVQRWKSFKPASTEEA